MSVLLLIEFLKSNRAVHCEPEGVDVYLWLLKCDMATGTCGFSGKPLLPLNFAGDFELVENWVRGQAQRNARDRSTKKNAKRPNCLPVATTELKKALENAYVGNARGETKKNAKQSNCFPIATTELKKAVENAPVAIGNARGHTKTELKKTLEKVCVECGKSDNTPTNKLDLMYGLYIHYNGCLKCAVCNEVGSEQEPLNSRTLFVKPCHMKCIDYGGGTTTEVISKFRGFNLFFKSPN